MNVLIKDATDVVTRKVSKHGIVHSLELFKGRTVKIVAVDTSLETPPEMISEKPYSDNESETPEVEKPPTFEMPNTLDRMREFVSS